MKGTWPWVATLRRLCRAPWFPRQISWVVQQKWMMESDSWSLDSARVPGLPLLMMQQWKEEEMGCRCCRQREAEV